MRYIDKILGAFLLMLGMAAIIAAYGHYAIEKSFIAHGYKRGAAPGCVQTFWLVPSIPDLKAGEGGQQ